MELNRLKVVLAEKKRTGLWLSHQLGVSSVTVSNGVQISLNQHFLYLIESLIS